MQRKVFIQTFGCQMNENDSERIMGILNHLNYMATDNPSFADMIILNTCSIREKAEQKIYSALGRLKRFKEVNPELIIGVGGCVAQQNKARLLRKVPHLDIVFGTHNIYRLPDLIKQVEDNRERVAATDFFEDALDYTAEDSPLLTQPVSVEGGYDHGIHRGKASVTIMIGCNNFCSYCIVPYVRGREISRKSSTILEEVKRLLANGIKEVTLAGQNVNSYGNIGGDISFTQLIRKVCRLEKIERVRFITSHPKDISEELINLFGKEERLCRHIHLPLQSGCDRILDKMNRGYTKNDYLNKVYKLKKLYPDMGITTDIIVGFPGETDADFLETLNVIKEIEFDNMFSFKYSQRMETLAASFDGQIANPIKEARLIMLQDIQKEITLRKNQQMVGKVRDVLIEGRSKNKAGKNGSGQFSGRTTCNRIVNIMTNNENIGKIAPIKIINAFHNSLLGEEMVNICY